jgi:regulator of sirC expression with transglutaminase-like and TPR domain
VNTREEAEEVLRRIAKASDETIDLAEGALALAALDRPRVGLDRYRDHLTSLASEVGALARDIARPDLASCAVAINTVLFRNHGYAGDTLTYDDMQNANLIRVIDRKKGLPVALGILYLHAGRAQGWSVYGINFPGHFLVALDVGGERVILDPFAGGAARQTDELRVLLKSVAGSEAELLPEHYAPMGNRDVLLRLENNIKLRQLRSGATDAALATLDAMLLFAPDRAELWREAGLLNARRGNLRAAVEALERFMTLDVGHAERYQIAALLQSLRSRIN